LPARPAASLTHGDLWLGNVVDGRWLVDPAVSYADRELDLAFMQGSGNLPDELFEAYQQEWPAKSCSTSWRVGADDCAPWRVTEMAAAAFANRRACEIR